MAKKSENLEQRGTSLAMLISQVFGDKKRQHKHRLSVVFYITNIGVTASSEYPISSGPNGTQLVGVGTQQTPTAS